jgi:hypothetical protein
VNSGSASIWSRARKNGEKTIDRLLLSAAATLGRRAVWVDGSSYRTDVRHATAHSVTLHIICKELTDFGRNAFGLGDALAKSDYLHLDAQRHVLEWQALPR